MNNVAVGAAHGTYSLSDYYRRTQHHLCNNTAHLKHNINRVIIFDIDLHHGQPKHPVHNMKMAH